MKLSRWILAILLSLFVGTLNAAERSYQEGTVTEVAAIRIESGHLDQYMAYLRGTWKVEQEALKKAGVIVSYAVYTTAPRTSSDPDVYLTITYANMAAMDGLDDRSEAAIAKAGGMDRTASQKGVVERNAYRSVIGTELIREITFK